jgi:hypothetical protein
MQNYGNVNRSRVSVVLMVVILSAALLLSGCSSGGGTGSGSNSGVMISGKVSAPGGAIAFKKATGWKSMLARMLSSDAIAQTNAIAPIPYITVNLVQLDDSGNQVAILKTTTTDSSGNYTLTAPPSFIPATTYLVVIGSNITLSSFVTSTTANIDPYTQTTVALITGAVNTAGASLSNVSSSDVAAVQEIVVQNMANVPTNLTADQMVNALQRVIQNNIENNNIVTSIVSSGAITGKVTDSNNAPLAGIKIVVRTFGKQLTQAFLRTDDSGNYTISVPPGDYVIGAINDTTTSAAASQWWTNAGGTISVWGGGKVTVDTTPVNINFKLGNGGRISGTVTGGLSNTPLVGIKVFLSDFDSGLPLIWATTLTDGTYSLNVPPGSNYYINFTNYMIAQPYASGNYNSTIPGGGVDNTQAEKITITAGGTVTASINLMDGGLIQGTVTDPITGVAAGLTVKFVDFVGAYAQGFSTGADGTYSIWLQPSPSPYYIYTRGQKASVTVNAGTTVTQDFNAPMSKITASIQDSGGNHVSNVMIALFSTSSPYTFLGWDATDGNGNIIQYATPGSTVYLVSAVTAGQMLGSQAYNGALNYPTNGTKIAVPADLGTISLPAGSVLRGKVVSALDSSVPLANSIVSVQYGTGTGGPYQLYAIRTKIDGSYSIGLPAGSTVRFLVALPWNYPGGLVTSSSYTQYLPIGAAGTTTTAPTLSY